MNHILNTCDAEAVPVWNKITSRPSTSKVFPLIGYPANLMDWKKITTWSSSCLEVFDLISWFLSANGVQPAVMENADVWMSIFHSLLLNLYPTLFKNAFSDFHHCWFVVGIATNFADAHDMFIHIPSVINNRLGLDLVQKPTQIKSVICS